MDGFEVVLLVWQPVDMTVPVAVQNVVPLRTLLVVLGCLQLFGCN